AATGKVDQPRPLRVLVVDDESNIRATLRICLEGLGCSVSEAATPERAIASISQQAADLAFVDLRLGSENGLDLIPKLLAENPGLDIVLITAYASFATPVEGIKRGARDYLPKPFTPAQIRHVVERVQSHHETERKLSELERQLAKLAPQPIFETQSPKMQAALAVISRAANSQATGLFSGDSGTGEGGLA